METEDSRPISRLRDLALLKWFGKRRARQNLGDRREFDMVRMFRRLLRTGSKQRVLGTWVL